jgi:signal transduction histidine kinase
MTADNSPGIPGAGNGALDAFRSFAWSPFALKTWRAVVAVWLGLFVSIASISVLSTLFSIGGSLLFLLVGIPFIGLGIEAARLFARAERWRMSMVDGQPLTPHPYRSFDPNPSAPWGPWIRQWAEAEFLDASRWLDVLYVLIALPLTIIEFTVTAVLWSISVGLMLAPVVLLAAQAGGLRLATAPGVQVDAGVVAGIVFLVGLVLLPVAASTTRGLVVLHRAVVQGMLCVDPADALRRDVERLRDSRSAALEVEASELRRIERDLHDGAQQRLVMLAIDLGMAEERIDTDPAAARRLVVDAREQARQALAELREVVRGVAPSILVDRGLVAALGAVAGRCPVPTYVDSSLGVGERLPHAVERAAYYVVAEALANVAKHSGATRCSVFLRASAGWLFVEVRDDGAGGAALTPDGGLAGLRDRVQALDGTLEVVSPAGGPTSLRVAMPVAWASTVQVTGPGAAPDPGPGPGQDARSAAD